MTDRSLKASETSWHALEAEEVARRFEVGSDGLTSEQARERLARHGPNSLEEEPPTPALIILLRQFRSPLIYILLAATAVTLVLEEYIDSGVIAAALVLNAVIGFTQERKAEGAVHALMGLVVPHARVVRQGQDLDIESREVVPGDMVLLEPGARVPADLRLVSTHALHIDESLLTGESVPPAKDAGRVPKSHPLADRTNMAYTGSVVTSGRGRGIAVATGTSSELGKIAGLIRSEEREETPLQQRMNRFAKLIGAAIGAASTLAFLSGLALGRTFQEMFLTAVALAVAAIPEGLPVVFTVTLALGVRRMSRRKAIVRRLPAVETLGSTTVIGSDKTGTLTQNRMTVREVWCGGRRLRSDGSEHSVWGSPDDESLRLTLLTGVLTNEAEVHGKDGEIESVGDPTEAALLVSAMAAGIDPDEARGKHRLVAEIPFESERRYSATFRTCDGKHAVFVKGAPERVVEMSSRMLTKDGVAPVDAERIKQAAHDLASEGLRVLAMAYAELDAPPQDPDHLDDPEGLVFLGLQGMLDPPREGVREAVDTCRDAGVRVVMITGDHEVTARAIGEQLGIAGPGEQALTGSKLASLSDEDLGECVAEVSIYARVSPEDKLRIVRALQRRDEVVAVTGDGVNDAPALKAAAIGIAMGKSGTDVAREAADMVLADDNFVTIAAAVEEGRVTFDNVRKVTFFLISTGAATIIAILAGVWMQWPLVMLPAQLLWLNLVTNGLQDIALAFEPGEKEVLRRPPRPKGEGIISRLLWERTFLAGAVMAGGTLFLFRWELDRTGSLAAAQTVALSTMVVFMAFHVGNSRSEWRSLARMSPVSNPFLFVATISAVTLHVVSLYLAPTQFVLRVEPIDAAAWLRIVAVAVSILVVVELDKLLRRRLRPGEV